LGRIIAPSETRIRTLICAIGADLLDELTGGWTVCCKRTLTERLPRRFGGCPTES
jgi:hypothetical protein